MLIELSPEMQFCVKAIMLQMQYIGSENACQHSLLASQRTWIEMSNDLDVKWAMANVDTVDSRSDKAWSTSVIREQPTDGFGSR